MRLRSATRKTSSLEAKESSSTKRKIMCTRKCLPCTSPQNQVVKSLSQTEIPINNRREVSIFVKGVECTVSVTEISYLSSYFRKLLNPQNGYYIPMPIHIKNVEPETMIQFLRFIQNKDNNLHFKDHEEALRLYSFAIDFSVPILRPKCTDFLIQHMDVNHILEVYEVFKLRDENKKVVEECKKYITYKTGEIFSSPKFEEIKEETLLEILDFDMLNVESEFEVYEAMVKWVEALDKRPGTKRDISELKALVETIKHTQVVNTSVQTSRVCINGVWYTKKVENFIVQERQIIQVNAGGSLAIESKNTDQPGTIEKRQKKRRKCSLWSKGIIKKPNKRLKIMNDIEADVSDDDMKKLLWNKMFCKIRYKAMSRDEFWSGPARSPYMPIQFLNIVQNNMRPSIWSNKLKRQFKLGHSASEAARKISKSFGEGSVNERTIRCWFAKFSAGDTDLENLPRGRPPSFVSLQSSEFFSSGIKSWCHVGKNVWKKKVRPRHEEMTDLLYEIINRKDLNLLDWLKGIGADFRVTNDDGHSFLDVAKKSNAHEIVDWLKVNNVCCTAQDDSTPLYLNEYAHPEVASTSTYNFANSHLKTLSNEVFSAPLINLPGTSSQEDPINTSCEVPSTSLTNDLSPLSNEVFSTPLLNLPGTSSQEDPINTSCEVQSTSLANDLSPLSNKFFSTPLLNLPGTSSQEDPINTSCEVQSSSLANELSPLSNEVFSAPLINLPGTSSQIDPINTSGEVPSTSLTNDLSPLSNEVFSTPLLNLPGTSSQEDPINTSCEVPSSSLANEVSPLSNEVFSAPLINLPGTSSQIDPINTSGEVPSTSLTNDLSPLSNEVFSTPLLNLPGTSSQEDPINTSCEVQSTSLANDLSSLFSVFPCRFTREVIRTALRNRYRTSFNQDPSPLANQDPSPLANQDPSPLANQDPSPLANQDPSPLATQDPSPLANQDPSPLANQVSIPSSCEVPSHIKAKLQTAVAANDIQLLEEVLKSVPRLQETDVWITQPLLYAALYGLEDVLKLLISYGANIELKDPDGSVALHLAAINNFSNVASLLIKNSANPNVKDNYGRTPLHYVGRCGAIDTLASLIFNGSPTALDNEGLNPIHTILLSRECEGKRFNMFAPLVTLSMATTEDSEGRTFLHYAALVNDISCVRHLLELDAFCDVRDNGCSTPLHYAAMNKSTVVLDFLLEYGANPNLKNCLGLTPLHISCLWGNIDAARNLVENSDSVSLIDVDKRVPLHYASACGHYEIVELLLDHQSPVDPLDEGGKTPLYYAYKYAFLDIVNLFVAEGFTKLDKTSVWTEEIQSSLTLVKNSHWKKRFQHLLKCPTTLEKITKNIVLSDK